MWFLQNNKKFWPDNRNETRKSRRVVEGGGWSKQEKESKFFYSPTDAQANCPKNNFKIYIKINICIKIAYTGCPTS